MNIFVRNNVDYTPIFWLWVAVSLIVLLVIYVEVMCATRRTALKRVRPLIEELLHKEDANLTVKAYINAVEDRFQDPHVWTRFRTIEDLPSLYMILEKKVDLVS